jgi:hypothetical protein
VFQSRQQHQRVIQSATIEGCGRWCRKEQLVFRADCLREKVIAGIRMHYRRIFARHAWCDETSKETLRKNAHTHLLNMLPQRLPTQKVHP